MQKYWRDRAFDHHRIIKQKGYRISRDMPAEIYGAFLTYYTRQELLESDYGEALMDLLQHLVRYQSYVILDHELGTRRIADLLNIKPAEARPLTDIFMRAFEELAPGRVFRDEEDFVDQVVFPRIVKALEASPEFAAACSALESTRIRVQPLRSDDSEYFYRDLPSDVAGQRSAPPSQQPWRALREGKGNTWSFRSGLDLYPADSGGNIMHGKFVSWVAVNIDFHKLDRAFIASGSYAADVFGEIARAWSGGGPFELIASPKVNIPIVF